jgi:integrase
MTIALRQRKTRAGTITLYLDCYDRGRRWLEYLSLYLTGDRHRDKETMRIAEARAAQRRLEAFGDQHGLSAPTKQKGDFIEYCRKLGKGKRAPNTRLVWKNAIARLEAFAGRLTFERLDADFLEQFRDHLLQDLKPNSAAVYLARIKTACRQAVKARILSRNPGENVTPIRKQDSQRVFLTLPELRKLERTECGNGAVKQAFLFSAFSGLRYSDVRPLTWGRVRRTGGAWALEFTQAKTGDSEMLPLSKEAADILRRASRNGASTSDAPVFALPAQQTIDRALKRWGRRAGLEKIISFHTGRHTFATLGLTHGVDLYTMSKLLGHRDVSTTQIYTKVVDQRKREAVEMFPTLTPRKGRHGKKG